jgi:hypothetical protein
MISPSYKNLLCSGAFLYPISAKRAQTTNNEIIGIIATLNCGEIYGVHVLVLIFPVMTHLKVAKITSPRKNKTMLENKTPHIVVDTVAKTVQ